MDDKSLEYHIYMIYNAVDNPNLWNDCLVDIGLSIEADTAKIEDEKEIKRPTLGKKININASNTKFNSFNKIDNFSLCEIETNTIAAYIGQSSDNLIKISFQRSSNQSKYDEAHITYLNRLLPHIKRALSLTKKLIKSDAETHFIQKFLDSTKNIIFIVSKDMKIIKKSIKAKKFIAKGRLITSSDNRIVAIPGLNQKDFQSSIISVTKKINTNTDTDTDTDTLYIPFLIPNSRNDGFYLMEISCFEVNTNFISDPLETDNFAIITFRELSNKHNSLFHRLKILYPLTDSETEISILLSNGLTPKEIAESRNRSIETIRTQIKQICNKVGLKNTSLLIAHINQIGN